MSFQYYNNYICEYNGNTWHRCIKFAIGFSMCAWLDQFQTLPSTPQSPSGSLITLAYSSFGSVTRSILRSTCVVLNEHFLKLDKLLRKWRQLLHKRGWIIVYVVFVFVFKWLLSCCQFVCTVQLLVYVHLWWLTCHLWCDVKGATHLEQSMQEETQNIKGATFAWQ